MRRPKLAMRAFVLLLGYALLCGAGGVFVAEAALHPGRKPLLATDVQSVRLMAHGHDSEITDANIVGADGTTLRGWVLRPRHGNRDFVMLLHGLSDNRMGTVGYAELLMSHGYSVLMADARAHGASGGEVASYGLLEANDIRRWVDWLQGQEQADCIYGFGESMGAAQLLESLSVEDRFCGVIAESSFSTFREIAYDRVGQAFHTGPWLGRSLLRPLVEVAFGYAKRKYKLNMEQVAPERAIGASRVPVFLIHGEDDSNIPVRHSRMIAKIDPAVALWIVPGAEHCGAIRVAREDFAQRVLAWYAMHGATYDALGRGATAGRDACRFRNDAVDARCSIAWHATP
jgi:alpha-beta hydrolase superfamily lysophospholipase